MHKISIIIPVYKVEKYLDKCIESVVNQPYKKLEIILVDDGSPDNSPKMCDEWAKKDKRIKVIHKTNGGVSSARNVGIEMATGDWITFIDSDDTINEEFSHFIEFALEKNCTLCYSDSFNNKFFQKNKTYEVLNGNDVANFFKHDFAISCWAKLIKKDFIVNNKLFFLNGPNSEDKEWIVRLLTKLDSISFFDKRVYNYGITDNSASISVKFVNFESVFRNSYLMFKDLKNSNFNARAQNIIMSQIVNSLYYLIAINGRFENDLQDYLFLIDNYKSLLIKPSKLKFKIVYYCVKLFGIKIAMIFFRKFIK